MHGPFEVSVFRDDLNELTQFMFKEEMNESSTQIGSLKNIFCIKTYLVGSSLTNNSIEFHNIWF